MVGIQQLFNLRTAFNSDGVCPFLPDPLAGKGVIANVHRDIADNLVPVDRNKEIAGTISQIEDIGFRESFKQIGRASCRERVLVAV